MPAERYVLGVDGGQTSTRSMLARIDGEVVSCGAGGPMVHFHAEGGRESNRAAIQRAIVEACRSAGVQCESVASVALGLTGVQLEAPEGPLVEALVRELLSPDVVVVVPDYVTNLAGAAAGGPGIVIIAGGGSISYGVTEDGRQALAGGYGYLLGDEGSGFDIGRQATMAAIRASDDCARATALQRIVMDALGLADMREIVRVVYDASFQHSRLADLTPMVARAADQGDRVASRIMHTAGRQLAMTCLAVVRRLYAPGETPTIYLSGGAFKNGDVVREPFRQHIQRCWGDADIRDATFSPVVGALILAAGKQGAEPGPRARWLDTVRKSLAGLELS